MSYKEILIPGIKIDKGLERTLCSSCSMKIGTLLLGESAGIELMGIKRSAATAKTDTQSKGKAVRPKEKCPPAGKPPQTKRPAAPCHVDVLGKGLDVLDTLRGASVENIESLPQDIN